MIVLWVIFYAVLAAVAFGLYKLFMLTVPGMYFSKKVNMEEFVIFNDKELQRRYAHRMMPMETLLEAYFDERLDFQGADLFETLKKRDFYANYALTWNHFRFLLTKFVPETLVHSKAEDERMVRWHYDRGDDFFSAFLGPRMVYTSGYYHTTDGSEGLEKGQDQKMDRVAQKLQLQPGDTHLDIGCGWGTFARHAATNFGTHSTGITISENQTKYGNQKIAETGLTGKAEILCKDYRDIPNKIWKKISCIEMIEHVGVKNYGKFLKQVYNLLDDDGLFFVQMCGLRRNYQWKDIVWGLFMGKYIFPGADASTPMGFVVDHLEKAGFELFSMENISYHYSITIFQWYQNWNKNKSDIVQKYGERWFRIWNFFLSWSVLIAREGTSACFQIVVNKNLNKFDRSTVHIPRGQKSAM